MHFSSEVTVTALDSSDLFNSVSLYVPASLAQDGIIGWAAMAGTLTVDQPVVLTINVNNYASMIQGNLLSQWLDVFNQDTNIDIVLYLIVFDDSRSGDWTIGKKAITYDPLTNAFNKLWFISYFKMMYDWNYDGKPFSIPFPGTYGSMTVTIHNGTGGSITLPAGTYMYNNGTKLYQLDVLADMPIGAGSSVTGVVMVASTIGVDGSLATGALTVGNFTPALSGGAATLTFTATAVTPGQNANPSPAPVPSQYFDLALALSYLGTSNVKLTLVINLTKIAVSGTGFPAISDVDTNPCRIRSLGKADQLQMQDLTMAATTPLPNPRENLFWGSLILINATNTWMIPHSEFVNVVSDILGAWMVTKNGSGEYTGNKLSKLRLTGTHIKPFGWPSPLNSAININDDEGFDMFDEMNLGYLMTISDASLQDCQVSQAKTVTGIPVNALMISKWIDYWSAQDAANFIADDGTLTDPVLTDQEAYTSIQNIVKNRLNAMSKTNRLQNIKLTFPSFSAAKVDATSLVAASAWSAKYIDDLGSVTVTGGISA
jgi:hypothetical protein